MKYKYAAVVVLYNPDENVKTDIESYINDVGHVYAVDNTENKNNYELINWLNEKDNITYIDLHRNEGLAKALNIGCHMAIKDGYDYAFTMDQDSYFEINAVKELIYYIENTSQDKVAIVAPRAVGIGKDAENYVIDNMEQEVIVKNWLMTSGGGVSLGKFLKMGDFDEALFVGHIDIEYGIRIHENGYEIHQIKKALMYQRLGNAEEKRLLWKKVHPYHGALYRCYYQTRNQYYILHKYGMKYKKFTNVYLWRSLIKIMLYEDKKWQHIKMLILGYIDGFRGRMGKCQYHYE